MGQSLSRARIPGKSSIGYSFRLHVNKHPLDIASGPISESFLDMKPRIPRKDESVRLAVEPCLLGTNGGLRTTTRGTTLLVQQIGFE